MPTTDDEIILEEDLQVTTDTTTETIVEPEPETEAEKEVRLKLEADARAEEAAAALILAEEERIRRQAFETDLKTRFDAFHDKNAAFNQLGISNPDLYFDQQILYHSSEEIAETRLIELELKDAELKKLADADDYLLKREHEYVKIDKLFKEAFAEKEEGNPLKMDQYLEKRAAIKLAFPKPV